MVLRTFLLLDLCSKGRGLGVVALVCIKSASKIYYIEIKAKNPSELQEKVNFSAICFRNCLDKKEILPEKHLLQNFY